MGPKGIKNLLALFFVCFTILSFPVRASADVLFGQVYFQALHQYFSQAKSSITVAMYYITLNPEDKNDLVNLLVGDLILAKKRGVKVKVILEDSKVKENRLAYEMLKENNVPVYFDTPNYLLHLKAVIVDGRYVFIGSANWAKPAMAGNYEATYFEDSAKNAIVTQYYIDIIPVQKKDILLPQDEGVLISSEFLFSPNLGRRLIKDRDHKKFDLYLLLCKLQQETNHPYLGIDYDYLAEKIGYTAPKNLGRYRDNHHYFYEKINNLLKSLKNDGLIGDYNKNSIVLKLGKTSNPGASLITIPIEYWEYTYSDSLSIEAKYMYLICLYEASRSKQPPFWFRSQQEMSKLYGVSDTMITSGLLELEKQWMLEITRDKAIPSDLSNRKANAYRVLPLNPK